MWGNGRPGPYQAYLDAAQLRVGLEVEPDARQLIGKYLGQRVEAGALSNRADVVAAIGRRGTGLV